MLGGGWARSWMASSLGPVAGVSRCSVVGWLDVRRLSAAKATLTSIGKLETWRRWMEVKIDALFVVETGH